MIARDLRTIAKHAGVIAIDPIREPQIVLRAEMTIEELRNAIRDHRNAIWEYAKHSGLGENYRTIAYGELQRTLQVAFGSRLHDFAALATKAVQEKRDTVDDAIIRMAAWSQKQLEMRGRA